MHYFTASDGAKIAYEEEGSGRPLVLLHGLMAHSHFFTFQHPLADDFRLIKIDLRGHGASRGAAHGLSVERMAEDVAALAAKLDLRDALLLGWSLGAAVLWRVLAGPAAPRFAASVVVDMTPRVLNNGEWRLGLSSEACEARTLSIRDDFEAFAVNAGQAIFAQPVDQMLRPVASWAGEEFTRNDPASMGAAWASLVGQDLRPLLPQIEQPTLIIHGAASQLYGPGTADYLAAALPNARAIQFGRSGHAPHMEQPELFNSSIREFAAGLPHARQNETTH